MSKKEQKISDQNPVGGLAGVRMMIETAVPAGELPAGPPHPDGPESAGPNDDGGPPWEDYDGPMPGEADFEGGSPPLPPAQLPERIEVTPLGVNGKSCFFINSHGQYIEMKASDFSANGISVLLDGNTDLMRSQWANDRGGWDAGLARDDLVRACAALGVFDIEDRLRGRGTWLDRDQETVVLHLGDQVRRDGVVMKPGLVGHYVYSARPPMLTPWPDAVPDSEMQPLLDVIGSWNFRRKELGRRAYLGFLAQGFINGLLPWRFHLFAMGDSGSGKSTLQTLAGYIFRGGCIETADATEAGLASTMGHDVLPILHDEFESEEDNRRMVAIIQLLRRSSSGAEKIRGSASHQAHSFLMRSPFLLAGILPPPLKSQDMNRLIFLELDQLEADVEPFRDDANFWGEIGRKLFRRMIDGIGDFNERLPLYMAKLKELGHDARGQKTFATALACADVAFSDAPPTPEQVAEWCAGLEPENLMEYEGVVPEWRRCLDYILQSQPDGWRNEFHFPDIGTLLHLYMTDRDKAPEGHRLRDALALGGLGLNVRRSDDRAELFIPASHRALSGLFKGHVLNGSSGANGGWLHAVRRGPSMVFDEDHRFVGGLWRNAKGKVGGRALKGVMVDIEKALEI